MVQPDGIVEVVKERTTSQLPIFLIQYVFVLDPRLTVPQSMVVPFANSDVCSGSMKISIFASEATVASFGKKSV